MKAEQCPEIKFDNKLSTMCKRGCSNAIEWNIECGSNTIRERQQCRLLVRNLEQSVRLDRETKEKSWLQVID